MASEALGVAAPTSAAPTPTQPPSSDGHGNHSFWALALGSIGVVFGDIGTSPLYAMREALAHSRNSASTEHAVLGVVSLVIWALFLVVTVKYVVLLMRADNKGEGGTLALMALARRTLTKSTGKRSAAVFFLGVIGAALFYGDGVITPAISVLSAMEGLKDAPGMGVRVDPYILPISAAILVGLFMVQSRGTHKVASFFGPITLIWFLILGALGLYHLGENLRIFAAFNRWFGVRFLFENGFLGFVILGSVFLAVTGAEALYADMGHFGKGPIRASWLVVVFPCLALNYLGQGAFILAHPAARHNPFWEMVPQFAYWPVLVLGACATVIASQAVITGAFSVTQQAVQLGLLPRIDIRRTSETQAGQIFVPQVNTMLMIGVLVLLFSFRNSHALASAYGIAVTGSMLVDTLLAFVIVRAAWKWSWAATLALLVPLVMLDLTFISSNLLKIPQGAWMPLVFGGVLVLWICSCTRACHVPAHAPRSWRRGPRSPSRSSRVRSRRARRSSPSAPSCERNRSRSSSPGSRRATSRAPPPVAIRRCRTRTASPRPHVE